MLKKIPKNIDLILENTVQQFGKAGEVQQTSCPVYKIFVFW